MAETDDWQFLIDAVQAEKHFWPGAALQRRIDSDGLQSLTLEFRVTGPDGRVWAVQGAREGDDSRRYAYFAPDGDFEAIERISYAGSNSPIGGDSVGRDGALGVFAGLRIGSPVANWAGRHSPGQLWDAPRNYFNGRHEGLDFGVPVGTPVLAVADGVVDGIGFSATGYGTYIRLKHWYQGHLWYSWYAHLDSVVVSAGDSVGSGEQIGQSGNSGNSTGAHLHLSIGLPGVGATGYASAWAVDPARLLARVRHVDLWPYLCGGQKERTYELRHTDGSQERVQPQIVKGALYLVKGESGQFEKLWLTDDFIWRGVDTSPADDPVTGDARFYVPSEGGALGARWVRRHMAVGDVFEGPGHFVQFYRKRDCERLDSNSGWARNWIRFQARYDTWRSAYGVELADVIQLDGEHESWWFARDIGMVAWRSAWGHSEISELHEIGARPRLAREGVPCMQSIVG